MAGPLHRFALGAIIGMVASDPMFREESARSDRRREQQHRRAYEWRRNAAHHLSAAEAKRQRRIERNKRLTTEPSP
jgi:hypothetical protein